MTACFSIKEIKTVCKTTTFLVFFFGGEGGGKMHETRVASN